MISKKTSLCIHGHFYQPPRENPWIEAIEAQDHVGGNFHDWNERISSECYRPNALARILDAKGYVQDIVNNFEYLSFNIGPTLLSWLAVYDPRSYERIIEADKNSMKAHHGHGNAIAQAYNHIIMPLANRQDKVTQVKWGIADFKKRFGRFPEAMWLPETAANEETLEVLIEEKMEFVILCPSQAEKFKAISDSHWTDVSGGNIDPKRAYRCFSSDNSGRYIDVFFYDGPISKAVAFDDLLYDAKIYASRLESAKDPRRPGDFINLAVDGETYGHHKAYGDRVLAYLFKAEIPHRGFVTTNYGEFLEKYPPEFEVKIKKGENGQGTSWSCPHGVKRWMEHCSCRGGGDDHWRQDWRKPLREALDWLRDELSMIFTKEGGKYLKDVWAARNDYIDIILDRGDAARWKFFEKHAKRKLSHEETIRSMQLLEMQRNAMLMYTSCGWFFTELSGEETVQIIEYATRAVQLMESVTGEDLTSEFLKRLARAESNIEFFKDGVGVYDYLVRPSIVTLSKVASHYAISSLFRERSDKIYCYTCENLDLKRETVGNLTLSAGRVKVRSQITLEEAEFVFTLLQSELYDFYCYVKPASEVKNYEALKEELFKEFSGGHHNKMGKIIYDHFGKEYFSIKDLFKEEKKYILELLFKDGLSRFKELYAELYERHKRMIDVYRLARIPLPTEYQFIVEHKLSDEFNKLINEKILSDQDMVDKAFAIRAWAKEATLKLDRKPAEQFLTKRLTKNMADAAEKWDNAKVKDSCHLMRVAERLGIMVDLRLAQENYLAIVDRLENEQNYLPGMSAQGVVDFLELGHLIAIDVDSFRSNLRKFITNPT